MKKENAKKRSKANQSSKNKVVQRFDSFKQNTFKAQNCSQKEIEGNGSKSMKGFNLRLSNKGQSAIESLLSAPVLIIILMVALVMVFAINESLFEVLLTANAAENSNIPAIRVFIGLIPFILTALVIVVIARSFGRPRQPSPSQGFP